MTNEPKTLLSRAECSALRGFAIIGIVLHNYLHWLSPFVKENEYQFYIDRSQGMFHALAHPNIDLLANLFSFFGHYGVPVFLFLSGYGLVMKYECGQPKHAENVSNSYSRGQWINNVLTFIKYHYLKLLKMMILGYVAFIMIDAIIPGRHSYSVTDIVSQMLMFINILPDPDHIIWPGPYWFFGLMLELYIVYRTLLYRRHWGYIVGLIAVCWLMQVFCDPVGDAINRIRYNFMGGMLPFGAGLLYARYGHDIGKGGWGLVAVISAVMCILFSFNFQLWLWEPLFVITFNIGIVKILPCGVMSVFDWMGKISAALFVAHPVTRRILIPISRQGDIYSGLFLYIIASISLAWLFRELLKRMPSPKLKRT
jgi:peptidoglycan/LPS O-acetylase OafA/YrhL